MVSIKGKDKGDSLAQTSRPPSTAMCPRLTPPGMGAGGGVRHTDPPVLPAAPGGGSVSKTFYASWKRRLRHQEVTQPVLGHTADK